LNSINRLKRFIKLDISPLQMDTESIGELEKPLPGEHLYQKVTTLEYQVKTLNEEPFPIVTQSFTIKAQTKHTPH
jgi:hypothetical protein